MSSRVLMLKGCFMCWYCRWGVCRHEERGKTRVSCPVSGFASGCPLMTADEMFEAMKTYKYYEESDW